jgi:hypothetical protein
MLGITADQSRTDQGVGIYIAGPQGLAVMGLNDDRLAGLKILQRGDRRIDLIAVHPQVTGTQTALLVFFQTQWGEFRRVDQGHRWTMVGREMPGSIIPLPGF